MSIRIPIKRWTEQTQVRGADGAVEIVNHEVDTTSMITAIAQATIEQKKTTGIEAFNIIGEIANATSEIKTDEVGEYIELGEATFKWLKVGIRENINPNAAFNSNIKSAVEDILSL